MNGFWGRLRNAVAEGRVDETLSLLQEALAGGRSREEILENGLLPAMHAVSDRFTRQEIYLPEVLVAVRAMEAAIERLGPGRGQGPAGRVAIGTVAGDLHDLGKRIVTLILRSEGIEVLDLGIDVSPAEFVRAVRELQPDILAMSALLTTTVGRFRETVELLEEAGLRRRVWVMVGGAPVTEELARAAGADAFARDGVEAAALAREFLRRGPRREGD